jgi:plastocyanin/anti-sigma regulatory factor (Ser/Thr protein kinase)
MFRLSFEAARLIALGAVLVAVVASEGNARAASSGSIEGSVTAGTASALTVVYVENVTPPGSRRDALQAVIRQKDSAFVPKVVVLVAGGAVTFPNDDFISHNVFSLSSGAKFDLGIYPTGDSRSVKFTVPGEVDVFCNIHPSMIAKILVLQNDHFVRVKPNGAFRLAGVPPGRHTLVAWSDTQTTVRVEVDVRSGHTTRQSFTLVPRGAMPPHLDKDLSRIRRNNPTPSLDFWVHPQAGGPSADVLIQPLDEPLNSTPPPSSSAPSEPVSDGGALSEIAVAEETLEMTMTVSPSRVSAVRRFVEEVAKRLGADANLSARMALTAHELLENVAKYGEARRGVLRLEAIPEHGPRKLVMTVANQASPAHVDRLKQAFNGMNTGDDPLSYYFTLMRSDVAAGESGLGLARIRAEGEMVLSLSIVQNEVSLLATSEPFAPPEETE